MLYSTKRRTLGLLIRRAAPLLALAGWGLVTGCATTDRSDMPWNAPHSWEGSPTIPGLSPGGY